MSQVLARSYGMAVGSASTYEIVYALAQYANTKAAVTTMVSNGEFVELAVGGVLAVLAYYGLEKGENILAAFAIPTSAFLIIDAIASIIKRNLPNVPTQLKQVATAGVRNVSLRQAVRPALPAPAPVASSTSNTRSN
jgi:hypothetical protein